MRLIYWKGKKLFRVDLTKNYIMKKRYALMTLIAGLMAITFSGCYVERRPYYGHHEYHRDHDRHDRDHDRYGYHRY